MAEEAQLIASLRAGDQTAFATLIECHTPALLRVARAYVPDPSIAEEVVQHTWVAVIKGIHRFESRSSLRKWLFAVLIDIAKSRGVREGDADALTEFEGATVPAERFHGSGEPGAGSWKEPLAAFPDSSEGTVLATELRDIAQRELDQLPGRQRTVVTLRDMVGFDSVEVCELLDISVTSQRVLLHRGHTAIRQVLEDYVREHVCAQGRRSEQSGGERFSCS